MTKGLLVSFFIIAAVLAIAVLVSGCSALPSMKYCDQVEYRREGSRIHVKAECAAPVGGSLPWL